MPRIVHLTSVHPPLDTRIFLKECKTLAAAGSEVVLVVPHEHDERIDGVWIRSVPVPKKRSDRMLKTCWEIYRTALEQRADAYHFHDPELIPVGLLLKARGKRVIYDVHEDVPRQILSKDWIPRVLRRLIAVGSEALEAVTSWVCDGIVAATPVIGRRFPAKKTVVVRNYPILEEFASCSEKAYILRPNKVAYIGAITTVRGAKELVTAMSFLPDVELNLAGPVNEQGLLEELKNLPGWSQTTFLGWQSRTGVAKLLGECRVGIVTLHPIVNYLDSYPIKLFEYMAAGLPVIASDFPLWRDIVQGAGCGLLVDPLDPRAIADAIRWLFDHPEEAEAMGQRGKVAVYSRYNWEHEGREFVAWYRALIAEQ